MSDAARRLVLVRHAKSDYPWGVADHYRPLNDRGRRDAPEIGRWLDAHVTWEDDAAPLILVSSAQRAQLTWALASERLSERWQGCTRRDEPRIYEASVTTLLGLVSAVPEDVDTVIVVGHNPGLVDLIESRCVVDETYLAAIAKFPTSAVAVLTTDEDWPTATGLESAFIVSAFAIPRG